MTYYDTDVLIHYFVNYEATKHLQAKQLVRQAVDNETFYCSLLCVQETSFVMTKLQQSLENINQAVNQLLLTTPMGYDLSSFRRAAVLAQHIGFKNINDCLHVALAEAHQCTELITYNRKDFTRLQPFTSLKINIL